MYITKGGDSCTVRSFIISTIRRMHEMGEACSMRGNDEDILKKCMTLVALMAASLTATVSWQIVSNVSEEVSVISFTVFLFYEDECCGFL